MLLNAFRKHDGSHFTPRPKDICAIPEGNTNLHLTESRLLERLLTDIEPAYEPCLAEIAKGNLNDRVREVFGGFAASFAVAPPAFRRIIIPSVVASLADHSEKLDDELPPFPICDDPKYSGRNFSDLVKEGLIYFDIFDPSYPQAVLLQKLGNLVNMYRFCRWDVLVISSENYFISSDYPLSIIDPVFKNSNSRFLPLSPKIGIVFHTLKYGESDSIGAVNFFNLTSKSIISSLNRAVAKSAETLIFSKFKDIWIEGYVKKYSKWRIESLPPDFSAKLVER